MTQPKIPKPNTTRNCLPPPPQSQILELNSLGYSYIVTLKVYGSPIFVIEVTDILEHNILLIFSSLAPKRKYFSLKIDVINHYRVQFGNIDLFIIYLLQIYLFFY